MIVFHTQSLENSSSMIARTVQRRQCKEVEKAVQSRRSMNRDNEKKGRMCCGNVCAFEL